MKTTKTLAKRAALITVLVIGNSTWLSAQQANQAQSGQTTGQNRQGSYGASGTNSQYNQGQSGQTTGQNRQGGYGANGTNGQFNQGQSGQTGGQNRQDSYGASGTNSQYNKGQSGQTSGQNRQGGYGTNGTNSQYNQGQTGGQNRQSSYGSYGTNNQYNQGQSGQAQGGLGQQDNSDSSESQALQVTKINKGSAIIGATVKNQQGESLGKIRDLVIDFNSGQVAYIVLDSETGLFNAAKLHAVPLRAFQPDAEGTSLILKTDKTELDSSEGFAKDNWPGTAAATWGAEPGWKDKQGTSKSSETYDADRQHTNDLNKTYQDSTPEPKRSQPRP